MEKVRSGLIENADEMVRLGKGIGRLLSGGDVVGLTGPLGSGKTTLARGIAAGLGLDPGYVVSSPTYTVMQSYPCGELEMFHLDLYRIEGMHDLDSTGYRDAVGAGRVLVVEWPEKEPSVLPQQHLLVEIEYSGEGRKVTITPVGHRYGSMLEDMPSPWDRS